MLNFDSFEVLSFDCYGTLIDWEGGILPVLRNVLETHQIHSTDPQILELFAQFESAAESRYFMKYRDVLQQVVQQFGEHFNFAPTVAELESLADSIKNWLPFPDTVDALKKLQQKYRLAVISNIDDDLFLGTAKHLKIEWDWLITAQQVQAYKPSKKNFEFALKTMGISPEKWLHIAQSVYHDIVPAKSLGLSTVWVNRRQGKAGFGATLPANSQPDLEVPDLKTLAAILT